MQRMVRWFRRAPMLACALALAVLGAGAGGCTRLFRPDTPDAAAGVAAPGAGPVAPAENGPAIPADAPAGEPVHPRPITIAAVGDLLFHLPVIRSGARPDGTYDFSGIFAPAAPHIRAADLALANLEVPLAGPEFGYTGYPSFNSPAELARDAAAAGFDVLTTANNHALDKGARGLRRTLDHLDQYGLYHTGTFRSPEERDRDLIVEVGGLRVGILAYTYGTNGIPVPEPWMVNLLDPAVVEADMARLRPRVDVLILVLHWGHEYATVPSPEQRALAGRFIAGGADIIFGSHPHVLQPAELREAGGRRAAVAYSLGNFISNQEGLERQVGVVVFVDVAPDRGVVGMRYLPTMVHRAVRDGRPVYRVLPVEAALRAEDPLITPADRRRLEDAWTLVTRRLPGSPGVELYPAVPPFPRGTGRPAP